MPDIGENALGSVRRARSRTSGSWTTERPPILLNLGCGSITHPEWRNYDIAPRDPTINDLDFRSRLPFADETADAIYHSHVLEHLDRDEAGFFVRENVRVLKPGGILRIVVPGLEHLCIDYLAALKDVRSGKDGAEQLHEWSLLDLMDQMIRRRTAGKMLEFLESIDLDAHPAIAARLTYEMRGHLQARATGRAHVRDPHKLTRHEISWRARHIARRVRERVARLAVYAIAGSSAAAAFTEGLFRNEGEVHQWMYDGHTLSRLMAHSGLVDVELLAADESGIEQFSRFELDTIKGATRRPGSLFAEGRKPI